MSSHLWNGIDKIKALMESQGSFASQKVDAILSSVMETIADALPAAPAPLLREGSSRAKAALEALERTTTVDEASPSYAAGRLSAAVDVLGYAAHQTADSAVVDLARQQPFARLLAILAKRPMRNVDLGKALGKDKARVSKWLATLREAGAVTSHKRGRELYNGLTPVGRLVVEQGWQDERRAPLEDSPVHSLSANRFDLTKRPAPADAQGTSLPRLSAA